MGDVSYVLLLLHGCLGATSEKRSRRGKCLWNAVEPWCEVSEAITAHPDGIRRFHCLARYLHLHPENHQVDPLGLFLLPEDGEGYRWIWTGPSTGSRLGSPVVDFNCLRS